MLVLLTQVNMDELCGLLVDQNVLDVPVTQAHNITNWE